VQDHEVLLQQRTSFRGGEVEIRDGGRPQTHRRMFAGNAPDGHFLEWLPEAVVRDGVRSLVVRELALFAKPERQLVLQVRSCSILMASRSARSSRC
jgi:hypothetical protein